MKYIAGLNRFFLCRICEWNASGTRTNVGGAWFYLWGIDWLVVVCYLL